MNILLFKSFSIQICAIPFPLSAKLRLYMIYMLSSLLCIPPCDCIYCDILVYALRIAKPLPVNIQYL